MTILYDFLRLLGALALFLYGMKMMSEALQKIAGSKMKNILQAMTSNRFVGLLTGLLVTSVIQSSSATTVMVVSFVNAGLISLTESIGVIMGTNIGTTITGWIIALLGFHADITTFALPAFGISIPFVLSKSSRKRSYGEFFAGFAMLFIGLDFMKSVIPAAETYPEILATVRSYADAGLFSVLIFTCLGALLTILVQSSSATLTLTLVLCCQGWIPFELGAAMILGENVGTTITANIAASVANISARRAAIVHFLFNLIGIVWVFVLFRPFLWLVDVVSQQLTGLSAFQSAAAMAIALALFHTMFNLCNSLIFIWFTSQIEKIVMRIKPSKESEEESFHLNFITTGILSPSELSLIQAKKEVSVFAKHANKMFGFVQDLYFGQNSSSRFDVVFNRIAKYEQISDDVEVEIANYLTKVNQGKLSDSGRMKARIMLRVIDELESVADCNYKIARLASKMRTQKWHFPAEIVPKVQLMFNMMEESLMIMTENLESNDYSADLARAKECEQRINRYRDQLKMEHLDNIRNNVYTYEVGICYMDVIQECETLADCVINISEAITEVYQY